MNQNKKKASQDTADAQQTHKQHRWQYDILLLAALAVIGIGIYFFFRSTARTPDQVSGDVSYYVQVHVNNRVEALIPLEAEGDYTFENIYTDGENVVHIENGGVSMLSANCPDKVCVYQGVIEAGTVIPIICMPNYVYVSIVASDEIEWDEIRESVIPEELMPLYEAWKAASQ